MTAIGESGHSAIAPWRSENVASKRASWRLLLRTAGTGPVVADIQALFHEPFEFGKTVDDGVGLVGIRRRSGEYLVYPRVLPPGTVKKDRRNAGTLCRDNIRRAVTDVPAIQPGHFMEIG